MSLTQKLHLHRTPPTPMTFSDLVLLHVDDVDYLVRKDNLFFFIATLPDCPSNVHNTHGKIVLDFSVS